MNSRIALAALGALLAGLWIGRALPQADLRQAREEIDHLKRAARERPASPRAAIAGVESMLQVRREDVAEARRFRHGPPPEGRTDGTNASASAGGAADPAPRRHRSVAGISNEIERVRQAWDLRREVARKNFIERAGLEKAQAADFDVLVDAMNVRLGTAIDQWAGRIRSNEVFTAETGVRMMNELSSAVVLTYEEMDRKLPAGWRDRAGPRFELVRFVDPEVLTPLQEVEDIMNRAEIGADEPGAPR